MSEFTKGPWVVNKTGIHWNNPSLCNIEIAFGEIGECICDTVYEEADAHLIAAAPDMYDLLKRLTSHDNCKKDIVHLLGEADSLLAKARGEL